MKSQKISLPIILLLLFIFFGYLNCKQEEIPVQEWTDFPIEVIYERVAPYVSNEETDSFVKLTVDDAEERIHWNGYFGMEMVKISETRFKYVVTKSIPIDLALWAKVTDMGKDAAGETPWTGEKIFINRIELVKVGRDQHGNPGTVAYFLIKKDGTVVP